MTLKEYHKKRKFNKTPEPKGRAAKVGKNRFVVQEHQASHWHHDFRLEMEGTLKSWAVPKGVPEEEGIKHLAVQVEDHPIEYIDFHGKIPEGQYGAGEVKIWDKGVFQLLERKSKAIKVKLSGKRLKGIYVLFNFKGKNWFFFKSAK